MRTNKQLDDLLYSELKNLDSSLSCCKCQECLQRKIAKLFLWDIHIDLSFYNYLNIISAQSTLVYELKHLSFVFNVSFVQSVSPQPNIEKLSLCDINF